MKRALYLSTMGGPRVSPNPFVGAVIVAGNRIIGEGYHRRYGGPHAEVNAVASVCEADRHLLKDATMYVTLEPCSHFGKTPPCADLLIHEGIPRVVIAARDPFLKDYESGIEKMRNAGIEVTVGLMRDEAYWINRRFFTAHTLKRPFVLLKWAQSANGFIANSDGSPVALSNPFTKMLMHRERSFYDAILVGTNTILHDNPQLTCRLWPCRDAGVRPRKVTFDSRSLTGMSDLEKGELIRMDRNETLKDFLHRLYEVYKITSLMVEGGKATIESFFKAGLYDEVRIEYSEKLIHMGIPAPDPNEYLRHMLMKALPLQVYGGNSIKYFVKNY